MLEYFQSLLLQICCMWENYLKIVLILLEIFFLCFHYMNICFSFLIWVASESRNLQVSNKFERILLRALRGNRRAVTITSLSTSCSGELKIIFTGKEIKVLSFYPFSDSTWQVCFSTNKYGWNNFVLDLFREKDLGV